MPIHAPVAGKGDRRQFLGAGDADIGEAALLLQSGEARFVHAALAGEQPILPARQEDDGVFQTLRAVQGHDADLVRLLAVGGIHHQGHMFQKALQVLELLQRLDQLLEVFEAAYSIQIFCYRFIHLRWILVIRRWSKIHRRIARFVKNTLGQFDVTGPAVDGISMPAPKPLHKGPQRRGSLAGQRLSLHRGGSTLQQRQPACPRLALDHLHRLVAEAALGDVDDALEGEVVGRADGEAEIGHRVADLLPLVEAGAADHAIGQADGHEAVLEGPHLVRGADENRNIVEAAPADAGAVAAVERLDLFADPARLGLAVPVADQANPFAALGLGPQRLAQPPLVAGDQPRRGAEDMRGRAIVLLQPHHMRAGKVAFESQDVADLGPAPAIDGLVVITHAAQVPVPLGQQPQPQILGDVGVLVFVDEDIAETLLPLPQHVRMRLEDGDAVKQQVAEIDGVQGDQTLLIGGIKGRALAVIGKAFRLRHVCRRQRAVLPAVDQPGQHPRGPALLVDVPGRDQLFQQPDLVVGVEDGEAGLEVHRAAAHQLGMAAQDLHADRMEGAEPRHALDLLPQQAADPFLHLACGLVGEGHGEDVGRAGAAGRDQMRDAGGQRPGLAGAGTRQHQDGTVQRLDRGALRRVQPLEIGRGSGGRPHRPL